MCVCVCVSESACVCVCVCFSVCAIDPQELSAEELKRYLEHLRPEDFGKFNP